MSVLRACFFHFGVTTLSATVVILITISAYLGLYNQLVSTDTTTELTGTHNMTAYYGTAPNTPTAGETDQSHGHSKMSLGSGGSRPTKEMGSKVKETVQNVQSATTDKKRRRRLCRKAYLTSRMPHSTKGTSSFQPRRIALSGDIQTNPGPNGKRPPKYPCKECSKNVRNNQDALPCATCKTWSHAKCLGMTKASFKYT